MWVVTLRPPCTYSHLLYFVQYCGLPPHGWYPCIILKQKLAPLLFVFSDHRTEQSEELESSMINSSNYSVYGMHSNTERYSWTAYHLIVFLLALFGDTLILYGSFQKEAFKIHSFIVTVIQHIAAADIILAISNILPRIISLLANSWVLGDPLCHITAHAIEITFPATTFLVALLTTSKLLVLKLPLRAANWDRIKAHWICCAIWMLCTMYSFIFYIIDTGNAEFNYKVYFCTLVINDNTRRKLKLICAFTASFVPILFIIGTTIPTLKYLSVARKSARRVGGNDPWQGALTVALTAILFVISVIPLSVYFICKSFIKSDPTGPFLFHLHRMAYFFSTLNIMSNFFIYTLTITSFRKFLYSKVIGIVHTLRKPNVVHSKFAGNREP